MIVRYLSSATAGIVVTTALIWGMQQLIEISENVVVPPRDRPTLDFVRIKEETRPIFDPDRPRPVDEPVAPPVTRTSDSLAGREPIRITGLQPAPPVSDAVGGPVAYPDSGLINIIHVQPEYPMSAIGRGLEGFVIVRFDVTPAGTVANAAVVESSHRILEKAAVAAAYKARYRPRTVDGAPQPAFGLQKLFRFQLEKPE